MQGFEYVLGKVGQHVHDALLCLELAKEYAEKNGKDQYLNRQVVLQELPPAESFIGRFLEL